MPGTADPVNRSRVRNTILDSMRTWHASGRWPSTPDLCTEERAVVAQAVDVVRATGSPPARAGGAAAGGANAAASPAGAARRLGRARRRPSGRVTRAAPAAVVERAAWRRRPDGPTRGPPGGAAPGRRRLVGRTGRSGHRHGPRDRRAGRGRGRGSRGARPGSRRGSTSRWGKCGTGPTRRRPSRAPSCATCRYVPRCPAHDVRGSMTSSRERPVARGPAVSPTSFDAWRRCRRQWRDRSLLRSRRRNPPDGPAHGLYLHRLLHQIHRRGTCHDVDHVREVLTAHGADERTTAEVGRHARRCPIGAEAVGHEVEWARSAPRAAGVHGDEPARRGVGARRDPRRARLQERSGHRPPGERGSARLAAGVGGRARGRRRAACVSGSATSTSRRRSTRTRSRGSPTRRGAGRRRGETLVTTADGDARRARLPRRVGRRRCADGARTGAAATTAPSRRDPGGPARPTPRPAGTPMRDEPARRGHRRRRSGRAARRRPDDSRSSRSTCSSGPRAPPTTTPAWR